MRPSDSEAAASVEGPCGDRQARRLRQAQVGYTRASPSKLL